MLVNHPWVMAAIALGFLALFIWLAPLAFRALRAEITAFAALLRNWTGEPRKPQLTPEQERRLTDSSAGRPARRMFSVIATADVKGLRNSIGTLCLMGQEAVFFSRRWWRCIERKIGPVIAIETRRGLLLDELALVDKAGRRTRFDLLAGQIETARHEASQHGSRSPVT
jgi:hypothetical protein